jgi:hypothetical protein
MTATFSLTARITSGGAGVVVHLDGDGRLRCLLSPCCMVPSPQDSRRGHRDEPAAVIHIVPLAGRRNRGRLGECGNSLQLGERLAVEV